MNPNQRRIIQSYKPKLEGMIDLEILKEHLENSKIFTITMLKDIYKGEKNLFEELPSRGPEAFSKFVKVLKDACYTLNAEELERLQHCDPENITQCPWTRVHCLIINNVTFRNNLPDRSNTVANDLEHVFHSNNMWEAPVLENNRSIESMNEILTNFSKKDYSKIDLCFVIILSHGAVKGDQNIVYGIDGEYMFESKIFDIFSTDSVYLSNIPKLFLLPCVNINNFHTELIKVPNFSGMYIVRWPCMEKLDRFGQILTERFLKCLELNDKTINLNDVVKDSYSLYYKNNQLNAAI